MLRGFLVVFAAVVGRDSQALVFSAGKFQVGNFPFRIVGGVTVSISDFPYQVAMFHNDLFICGGSIIGPTQILTAAHCIASPSPSSWSVRAGSASLSQDSTTTQIRRASSVIPHPQFNGSTFLNDIAVVILSEPLSLSKGVQAIELPSESTELSPFDPLVATGWGATQTGGFAIDKLMKVDVPLVSPEACRRMFTIIVDSMLCAGSAGKGICKGDSGGPLVTTVGFGRQLVGISSFSAMYACAHPDYADGYTKVSAFRSWIATNAGV